MNAPDDRDRRRPVSREHAREPETPFTNLVKFTIGSSGATNRLILLLVATGGLVLLLLGLVAAIATILGPTVAAIAGGLPVSSAALGVLWSRRRRR